MCMQIFNYEQKLMVFLGLNKKNSNKGFKKSRWIKKSSLFGAILKIFVCKFVFQIELLSNSGFEKMI